MYCSICKENDEIVALAGASIVDDDLREIGIDVKRSIVEKLGFIIST